MVVFIGRSPPAPTVPRIEWILTNHSLNDWMSSHEQAVRIPSKARSFRETTLKTSQQRMGKKHRTQETNLARKSQTAGQEVKACLWVSKYWKKMERFQVYKMLSRG